MSADQIETLLAKVYALSDTYDEIKALSSHIIANGDVSPELMKALSELHQSLTYTFSIAEFIEQKTRAGQ